VASVRHSFARLFAYGLLSVILVFYLIGLGLAEAQSGLVLTLTLAGDVVVSLLLTTQADRIGRRRMLNRPVCTKRKLPSVFGREQYATGQPAQSREKARLHCRSD
jgi:MFS family permease